LQELLVPSRRVALLPVRQGLQHLRVLLGQPQVQLQVLAVPQVLPLQLVPQAEVQELLQQALLRLPGLVQVVRQPQVLRRERVEPLA
jgi:hypothetical protein